MVTPAEIQDISAVKFSFFAVKVAKRFQPLTEEEVQTTAEKTRHAVQGTHRIWRRVQTPAPSLPRGSAKRLRRLCHHCTRPH